MSEPRLLRLSRVIAVAQGPVVLPQARRLRKAVPRLPDALAPWRGEVAGPDPLRLLALGDSTVAGTGVVEASDGIAGRLAHALHARLGRGVLWRAVGENGATSRDLLERHLDEALAEPFDLVFLSFGANDALGLRAAAAFARDLGRLLTRLESAQPDAAVVMSSLPVFGRFDLLPEPLRTALFRHSRNLERAARAVIDRDPSRIMNAEPPPYADDFFASDGFHPGPHGYRDWADWAVDDAMARGLAARLGSRA